MNMVTCTAQHIIDLYEGANADPFGPGVVIYSLNQQSHINMVCFHSITNGQVLCCFAVSDAKTLTQWLDGRTKIDSDPLYMTPLEVGSLDADLNILTATGEQYQRVISAIDVGVELYTVDQQGNIARAALLDPTNGGKVMIKGIISDTVSESWWNTHVAASDCKVDAIDFSTAAA